MFIGRSFKLSSALGGRLQEFSVVCPVRPGCAAAAQSLTSATAARAHFGRFCNRCVVISKLVESIDYRWLGCPHRQDTKL